MELLLLLISTIRRNILVDSSIYLFAHILSPISITFFTYKFLTLDYVYFFLNFTGVSNFGWGNIGIIYKKRKKKKELFSINTMIVIQSNQRIFFEKKKERERGREKKKRKEKFHDCPSLSRRWGGVAWQRLPLDKIKNYCISRARPRQVSSYYLADEYIRVAFAMQQVLTGA